MKTGIYTIISQINNRVYVGSTTNTFNRRWNQHKSSLRLNKHRNIHLQRHFNKYRINDLKFEILEECDSEYCLSKELYWINLLDSVKYGFNQTYNSISQNGKQNPNYKHFDENGFIKDYLTNQYSILKLSKKYNINVKKGRKVLKDNNINVINSKKIDYKININEVYNDYIINNKSMRTIASELKVSRLTLSKCFNDHNLPIKIKING